MSHTPSSEPSSVALHNIIFKVYFKFSTICPNPKTARTGDPKLIPNGIKILQLRTIGLNYRQFRKINTKHALIIFSQI